MTQEKSPEYSSCAVELSSCQCVEYSANPGFVKCTTRVQVVTLVDDGQPEVQEQQKDAFLQEVQNMRRLNKSPHVVRIFGIVTSIPR